MQEFGMLLRLKLTSISRGTYFKTYIWLQRKTDKKNWGNET